MTLERIRRLADFCEQSLELREAKLGEEYYYQSLPLCIMDAVFSIGVRYESTRAVVMKYCDYFGQRRIRQDAASLPREDEQESVEAFLQKADQYGIDSLTTHIFRNRQRTSTRNGILKSQAVYQFASVLRKYGVNYFQDVPKVMLDLQLEREIKAIPGQGSGISLRYFFMLAGSDQMIKPDRMVLRFLQQALGAAPALEECQSLLQEASHELQGKYERMNPRLLDYQIWSYTRA